MSPHRGRRGEDGASGVLAGTGLSQRGQRSALAALTLVSRLGLRRRTAALPPLGQQDHLTSVLRLGAGAVPVANVARRHYVYPPETVHVTVSNLDRAGASLDDAIDRLSRVALPAPRFSIDKLGCSPDTIFLRCAHDDGFDRLREAVELAFEVPAPRSPASWLFRRLSFANIVRFDGPGEWIRTADVECRVRCTQLEIVRTDRYLSGSGTSVLHTISLPHDI